jgi:uncharacterized protein YbjT (DUF2867 family)
VRKKKIVIAGHSGYIGKALVSELKKLNKYELVGISRNAASSDDDDYTVRKANLFSMLEAENALEGGDIGIFLVHSMSPNDRLAQGRFSDFDYIIADNFARTAARFNFEKIIYLSGLCSENDKLSSHLKSRLEVEKIFRSYNTPTTIIRSGLIIGSEGSSFRMIVRLIENLPVMICPAWATRRTQAVSLESVVDCLKDRIDEPCECDIRVDIGAKPVVSYKKLLELFSRAMNKKRFIISVNIDITKLSKLWVSIFSGAPYSLTGPLIDSLNNNTLVDEEYSTLNKKIASEDLYTSIKRGVEEYYSATEVKPYAFKNRMTVSGQVTSVQRIALPHGMSARDVAYLYIEWVSTLPFISTARDFTEAQFKLPFLKPILELSLSEARSTDDRVLFYVTGGLLAKVHEKGRFEFRETRDKRYFLVALQNFRPKIPWYVYLITQAPIHKLTMLLFAIYMKRRRGRKKREAIRKEKAY